MAGACKVLTIKFFFCVCVKIKYLVHSAFLSVRSPLSSDSQVSIVCHLPLGAQRCCTFNSSNCLSVDELSSGRTLVNYSTIFLPLAKISFAYGITGHNWLRLTRRSFLGNLNGRVGGSRSGVKS